jgi:hypothetical protein
LCFPRASPETSFFSHFRPRVVLRPPRLCTTATFSSRFPTSRRRIEFGGVPRPYIGPCIQHLDIPIASIESEGQASLESAIIVDDGSSASHSGRAFVPGSRFPTAPRAPAIQPANLFQSGSSVTGKMAVSESSQFLAPPSRTETAPAPRRTALPSRPMSSKDLGEIARRSTHAPVSSEDQEQTRSDAGASPTPTGTPAASPIPRSPTHFKEGSPSGRSKVQTGPDQGYTGQVCR